MIKKFSLLNHTHGVSIRTIVSSVVRWSSLLRWLVVCFHSPRITWLEVMWINEDRRALNSELTQEDGGVKKTANRVWQASNGFVSKRSSPNFPVFFKQMFCLWTSRRVLVKRGVGVGASLTLTLTLKQHYLKKDRSRPRVFLTPDYNKGVRYSPATFVTPESFPFSSILPSCYVSWLMPDVGKLERRNHNGLWLMFWFFYFLNCGCRNCRITK